MFIRTTKNKSGRTYLKVVRSVRVNGKVKQEVLFSMGRLDVLIATGQIDAIVSALSRYATQQNLINLAQDVSIEKVYHLGSAHVIRRLMERTHLISCLENIADQHERLELPFSELIMAMVCSRFIDPCSKKRLQEEWFKKIYPGVLQVGDVPLEQLYRALDILYQDKERVENHLFDRTGDRDLFNQTMDVVFYDTTTLRFESVVVEEVGLRQFGYSKERRTDCTQVVLGLLIDRDGIPVGYRLFPGNTYDGRSVPAILEKFKEKFSIGRIVFVADRGMLSRDNLKSLKVANIPFIIGMRLWSVAEDHQKDFYNVRKYRAVSAGLKVREMVWGDDRLILTWSQERAERDAKAREDILGKIREKLKCHPDPKKFVTNQAYRQFLKGLDEGAPTIDPKAVEESRKRDGFYGILTNVAQSEMKERDVVTQYKELWKIEDAFGEMKGPLETRPMFHWTNKRIEAHVLVCVLAYYLEAIITRTFRQKEAGLTATEFFRGLNDVHAIPVQVRHNTVWVRNALPEKAAKGYQLLQIKPPDRVLKIHEVLSKTQPVVTQN